MLKNVSRLEHVVNDKFYHLLCDSDSPISDVKDALFQFLKYIGNVEDQIKAAKAKEEAEKAASQPSATVVVDEAPKPE